MLMQIDCPTCRTAYQLADAAIGPGGRAVRCARCQQTWRVEAPARTTEEAASVAAFATELGSPPPARTGPSPPAADDAATEALVSEGSDADNPLSEQPGAGLSGITIPADEAPPLQPEAGDGGAPPPMVSLDDNGPPDIESVAARRARTRAHQRPKRMRVPLSAVIAALAVLSIGLLHWRKAVVTRAPQLASLYSAIGLPVNLKGLEFTDLRVGNETDDGVPVLVIEGVIVSTTSNTARIPRLRFGLRNAAGVEIYAWTAPPPQPSLAAFTTTPFRTRLAAPPAEGHDVQVRFFTHQDAIAGLN